MDCTTTYTYYGLNVTPTKNQGQLKETQEICLVNDNVNSFIFMIEFIIVFYIFMKLMNYSSGIVSRLIK